MRRKWYLFLILLLQSKTYADFRFSLPDAQINLDPHSVERSSGQYVLGNLYRSYFFFDKNSELKSDLANKCTWTSNKDLICEMRAVSYANGQPIRVKDYLRSFTHIFSDKKYFKVAQKYSSLLNAEEILKGLKKPIDLGVYTLAEDKLHFKLQRPDADFIYKLTSLSVTPRPDVDLSHIERAMKFSTGPYKLAAYKTDRIELDNNLHYHVVHKRPKVIAISVLEDFTALNMFLKGELDYLRQVPTEKFNEFKKDPRFQLVQMQRFDYIGMSGGLTSDEALRKRIATSINYGDFKKVFHAAGSPGCFGLNLKGLKVPCYEFSNNGPSLIKNSITYTFFFAGPQVTKDISRTVEWFQAQLKKNLNLHIELKEEEFAQLTKHIETNPPDLFRKGVPLEYPSCYDALKVFHSKSHENTLKINLPRYDEIVTELSLPDLNEKKSLKLCHEGLTLLLSTYRLIPLGAIHFGTLTSAKYLGVDLNSLNQLDLALLRYAK